MGTSIFLVPLILSTILAAIMVVFLKNLLHSALMLAVCLLLIAIVYVFLLADFLAVTQILIYAGGILVIILFGIMLTQKIGVSNYSVINSNKWIAIVLCLFFFLVLASQIYALDILPIKSTNLVSTIKPIGNALLTSYLLPFELITILLTISLLGAAVIAGKPSKKDNNG